MIDAGSLETLLHIPEGETLDFKGAHYQLNQDHEKAEFVKDILAFANGWRTGDAFILTGVLEPEDGKRAEIKGVVGPHPDDADLQQLVNGKTNRPIQFAYFPAQVDGKSIGVIRIPTGQERPFFLKKDLLPLKSNRVYVRRGSSTAEGDLDEVARMGQARSTIVASNREVTLEDLAETFRDERTAFHDPQSLLASVSHGKVVLHLFPASARPKNATVKLDKSELLPALEPMDSAGSFGSRHNIEGLLSSSQRHEGRHSYALLTRSGVVEAAYHCTADDPNGGSLACPWQIEDEVIRFLRRTLPALAARDAGGPAAVVLSLLGLTGAHAPPAPFRGAGIGCDIDRYKVHLPTTVVDLEADAELPALMRPAFDTMWQAMGMPRSLVYDESGVWTGSDFRWR